MEETAKKRSPFGERYPDITHIRSSEPSKPLCGATTQKNLKFAEDGQVATCRSCNKRSKRK